MNVRTILVVIGLISCAMVVVASNHSNIDKTGIKIKPNFYLDPSKEKVKIDFEVAKSIAEKHVPAVKWARMLHSGLVYDKLFGKKVWELNFKTRDEKHISVCVDANTGEVVYMWDESKMSVGKRCISDAEAKKIADTFLMSKKNNLSSLVFSSITYNPSEEKEYAAKYDVHYPRLIKGIPCLSDGITISINTQTGEVVSYYKVWAIPEKDCISPTPSLSKENAENLLRNYMEKKHSTKINILSTKLVWIDVNYPHPMDKESDVRLAWWIKFDDSHVKSNNLPPAAAWIDSHSGEVLKVVYDIG